MVLHALSPDGRARAHPPLPSKEPLDKPIVNGVQSRAMKRLAGWLIPVAFGLVACGYIPGSADDPSVSPAPSPTEAALVLPSPAGSPDIPSPVAYNPWASPAPTLAPPTVDTAPDPAAYPASASASNPSIAVFCNVYFENGTAMLVVAVKDRASGQYVADATVTAWMVGTDAKYAAAPVTQFSGSGATVDSNHLPGVATYRFSFPFAVPSVQYDGQGNQLPSAYATYRCKATATWQGQTASF